MVRSGAAVGRPMWQQEVEQAPRRLELSLTAALTVLEALGELGAPADEVRAVRTWLVGALAGVMTLPDEVEHTARVLVDDGWELFDAVRAAWALAD